MCVTFSLELVEGLLKLVCLAEQGEVWKEEALMVVQKVEQVEKMVVAL